MMFQHDHGLTVDAFAGPHVWRALLADAIAGKQRTDGYSYVYVHRNVPQLLTLWHNGKVVLTLAGQHRRPGRADPARHVPGVRAHPGRDDERHGTRTARTTTIPGSAGSATSTAARRSTRSTAASFGTPQSLGCVELPLATAAKVWPYTPIGTLVTIEN